MSGLSWSESTAATAVLKDGVVRVVEVNELLVNNLAWLLPLQVVGNAKALGAPPLPHWAVNDAGAPPRPSVRLAALSAPNISFP